jgi:hypothetical protein
VVTALIVPFCVLAGILLTNAVMGSMDSAMNAYSSGRTTIGGQLLVTIGADCYTGSGDKSAVMAAFVSGQYDYLDIDLVKANFDIQKMNWLLGLLGSLAMLISFLLSAVTFVQRIFDIVLLYIVSPISVSTIPLDDGNRFKVWKDMMVSKILSAYGIILSMNLFFLIMPQVYRIRFFEGDFQNGVVNVLFLIGGRHRAGKELHAALEQRPPRKLNRQPRRRDEAAQEGPERQDGSPRRELRGQRQEAAPADEFRHEARRL